MAKRILFLLATLLAAHSLRAQWVEQGFDLVPDDGYVYNLKAIDNQTVWANLRLYSTAPATVVRSTNGGNSWQTFEIPNSPNTTAVGLSAQNASTAWVSLRSNAFPFDPSLSKIVRTTDGGSTWQVLLSGPAAGGIVHFFDGQNGLSYVNGENVKVTSNGGQTWQSPTSMPAVIGLTFNYNLGENYDVVGNTIWIGLRNGTLLKSTDQGKNWTLQTTPLNSALSGVSFTDANNGMATSMFSQGLQEIYPSRVLRTTNGGQTWTEIPASNLPLQSNGFFTKALEGIPGTAGTYLLSVGGSGGYGFKIYKTLNQGNTWTLYSNCPQSGFGIETFDFLSPTVGWAGSGGASSEGPFFYKATTDIIQSTVTYRVDLGNLPPSGAGVHVATDYDGWDPSAHPMNNVDGSVWETTLAYPVGTTIRYKFINGNAWGQNESVPEACGVQNSAGSYDRLVTLECNDPQLTAFEFSACMVPGERAPQGNFWCNPNVYTVCETFESYNIGQLSTQSNQWTLEGCYSGVGDCDADVVSYYSGFTNHSGGRGMHMYAGGFVDFDLGNQSGGAYELALKIYFPSGSSGGFFVNSEEGVLAYPSFYDGYLDVFNSNFEADVSTTYPPNEWLDLMFLFDFDNQHREVWLNGEQLVSANDLAMVGLYNLAFYGDENAGYFVDDITLKPVPSGGSAGPSKPTPTQLATTERVQRPNSPLALRSRVVHHTSADKSVYNEHFVYRRAFGREDETVLQAAPASDLELFPNPASTSVSARYRMDQSTSAVLTLVNTLGQTIQMQSLTQVPQGICTFDLSSLPAGLYSIQLVAGGKVTAQQFVKQ